MDRRKYLVTIGGISTTALSGCMGSEDNNQDGGNGEGDTSESDGENDGSEDTTEPNFSLRNLSVTPSSVDAGEPVGISVDIRNDGEDSGVQNIELTVDGEVVDSEEIELGGGESTTAEFTISVEEPRTHTIAIGDLESSFEVSGMEVGGIIDADTTWTAKDGPYEVVDTVQVAEDTTLTIKPDVSVWATDGLGRDSIFRLHGEIIAKGTSSKQITFDGRGNNSTFFDAEGSPPEAFLDVEYCTIRNGGSFWMRGYGGFNLRYSTLKNIDPSYIWYPFRGTQVEYDTPRSEIYIEYNKFINSGGFSIGHNNRYDDEIVRVNIRNNVFKGWKGATYGGLINNWNSSESSETIVEYNSFLDMTDEIVLKLPSGYDDAGMTAPNNYWGTTDEDTIEGMIYDANDDIDAAGEIEYTPILDEPHPDTPTLE